MHWAPAIPWKREHFPLADSCDFGPCSDYRTPVHLWFLASVCVLSTGAPDAPCPGRGRLEPARVSWLRGRSGLRGQGRPRRGRRQARARIVVNVEVRTHDAILQLAIRDDGIGGADLSQGSALLGLGDRIEALGGTLQLTSPPTAAPRC